MTIRTTTPSLLDNPPVPLQAKLAAAWTSFMFFYIYVDYFHFYKPGAIDEIRGGVIFVFDITGCADFSRRTQEKAPTEDDET